MTLFQRSLIGFILLSGNIQAAEYYCSNSNQSLEVRVASETNDISGDLTVYEGENESLVAHFEGSEVDSDAHGSFSLFSKRHFKVTDQQGVDGEIDIISKPRLGRGGCGRGSCDFNTTKVMLHYRGESKTYDCL